MTYFYFACGFQTDSVTIRMIHLQENPNCYCVNKTQWKKIVEKKLPQHYTPDEDVSA